MKRVDLLGALKTTRAKGEKVQLPIGPILIMLAALGGLAYYILVFVKDAEELLAEDRQRVTKIKSEIADLKTRNEFFKQVGPFYDTKITSIKAEIKKIVDANTAEENKSQGLPLRLFTSKLEKVLEELCGPNEDGSIPEKPSQQFISYERTGDQIILRGLTKDYDFPARLALKLAELKDQSFRQEPVWEESGVKEINRVAFSNDSIQKEVEEYSPEKEKSRSDKPSGGAKTGAPAASPAKSGKGSSEAKPKTDKPADTKKEKEPEKASSDKDARSPLASPSHSVAQEVVGGVSAVPGPAFRIGSVMRVSTKSAPWKLTPIVVYEFEIRMEATEVK